MDQNIPDLFWSFRPSKAFRIIERYGPYTVTQDVTTESHTLWCYNRVIAQGRMPALKANPEVPADMWTGAEARRLIRSLRADPPVGRWEWVWNPHNSGKIKEFIYDDERVDRLYELGITWR